MVYKALRIAHTTKSRTDMDVTSGWRLVEVTPDGAPTPELCPTRITCLIEAPYRASVRTDHELPQQASAIRSRYLVPSLISEAKE